MPLAWQLTNIAGWVARSVTAIFENIGTVQDGMRSIDVPRQMPDPPDAVRAACHRRRNPLRGSCISTTAACARRIGTVPRPAVLHGIDLTIAPGERVGLVGPSGAGKSTLVNLLLHFYDPARGPHPDRRPGHRAASRRRACAAQIAMVTQDTSLLHRSIRDNIRYGRPRRHRGDDRRCRAPGRGARVHPRAGGLARPHAATTRMSASAA